ncbi:MAG TPA: hypothetical protein ENH94_01155 [Phycisphaerales bacterium]|nr:hypothetical protein [Phycisphaerales bacterium]
MLIIKEKTASASFDMTPIIDIVFLLIIFFMLVCQFIAAENFQVTVPDQIDAANPHEADIDQLTTVTVIARGEQAAAFAVGPDIIGTPETENITDLLTAAIDTRMETTNPNRRIINLRIDKSIPYSTTRIALEAISESSATDIKLAATKQ